MSTARRPDLRASDADRERAVDVLSAHAGEGRLTVDELSERTDAAFAARTLGELDALLADLPALPVVAQASAPVPEEQEVHDHFREHLVAYIAVNVMLIGIWAATGAGYFWPIFPLLGWGVGVALDYMGTRNAARRIRSAPDPETRAQIVARAAKRREGHGLPAPPRPPRAPRA